MYVVLLSAIGPVGLAVTTNLNINFLRKGAPGQDVLAEARILKLGKRLAVGEVRLLSGDVTRSDRPCHSDIFHSKSIGFSEVLLYHIYKPLFLLDKITSFWR